jgi:phospholipase C
MSTCTKWVDTIVITCKNWRSEVDYECTSWADEGSSECSQWADEGSNQCSQWADEGSNRCSQWADEGSNQCTAWDECHWYTPWNCIAGFFCRAWYWVAKWVCLAWYWVANLVCQAWYWVANLVCQAWYWVANLVCQAFAWVVHAFCIAFSWLLQLVCVAWDTLRCALLGLINAIASLFGRDGAARPKIEHVFVLMLENRSFDHMLGFSGITGVDPSGNPTVFNAGFNPAVTGNIDPLTNALVTVGHPADFQLKNVDKDPGHEFEDTLVALCGAGAVYNPVPSGYPPVDNSGFIANYLDDGSATPERIMNCYDPGQLPVLNALAREFAVCDQWFSSLPGPTWPNRFFLLAATSGGLDGSPSTLDVVTATGVEGYRFQNGNVFDLLDANCISWRIFEGDEFPVSFALKGMDLNALQGRFKDFDDFASEVNKVTFGERFVFIEPKYGSHGFDVTGPGDFTCGDSMHPLDDVVRGEALIKKVYETIRNSPHWEHSLLIITFDEHGGFYDHVPPGPAVPPGDLETASYVQHGFKFDQLGVRVPALVISPYTGRGVIDHTVYDHTSMLATVERLFGMGNLTNRDQAANDVLHLLPLATPRTNTPTTLPPVAINPHPLTCEEDDDETEDGLLIRRSELRIAKRAGSYRDRDVGAYPMTRTQIGFLQVALLRVLQTSEYPERTQWIEDYKGIVTGIDAALFMAEAKLKVRFGMDLKKLRREGTLEARQIKRRIQRS